MNSEQLKKEYDDRGFVVVKNFFSPEEVRRVEDELNRFVETHSQGLKRDEINYSKPGVINSIHRLAGYDSNTETYFGTLLNGDKVGNLAAIFLADKADPRRAEFFGKPAKVGLKSPWHQDNFYWGVADANALTIWLALDHCDESNGGITYIEGSHKLGVVDHTDSFAPGSSQMVKEGKYTNGEMGAVICPTLEPGDVVIHHSLTIHGSADNTSERSRRGITFQYKGVNSNYDEEMIKHYRSRLNIQVDMREKKATTDNA